MKEQANNEAELWREELEAYKDSMALLAGAIAGRRQSDQQPPYYMLCNMILTIRKHITNFNSMY